MVCSRFRHWTCQIESEWKFWLAAFVDGVERCRLNMLKVMTMQLFDLSVLDRSTQRSGKQFLDLLQTDEHTHVPAAESHKVRNETFVERAKAFVRDDVRHDADQVGGHARLIVHHASFKHIDWRADDACIQASSESAKNVDVRTITQAKVIKGDLLVLIVRCNLCSVDDRIAQDIGAPADPEAFDTILGNDALVAVNRAGVWSLVNGHLSLCLHSDFDYIGRVCHRDGDGSCGHTGHDLLQKSWVLSWLQLSTDCVTYRHVETDTKSSE